MGVGFAFCTDSSPLTGATLEYALIYTHLCCKFFFIVEQRDQVRLNFVALMGMWACRYRKSECFNYLLAIYCRITVTFSRLQHVRDEPGNSKASILSETFQVVRCAPLPEPCLFQPVYVKDKAVVTDGEPCHCCYIIVVASRWYGPGPGPDTQ